MNRTQKKALHELIGLIIEHHGKVESDLCICTWIDCFDAGFPETTLYCLDQGATLLFGRMIRANAPNRCFLFQRRVVTNHSFKEVSCLNKGSLLDKLGFGHRLLLTTPSEKKILVKDSEGPWTFIRVCGTEIYCSAADPTVVEANEDFSQHFERLTRRILDTKE